GVRIKQHTQKESMLIAYMCEFELTAPVELQEVGYYAGFGHLGSQGFGCVGREILTHEKDCDLAQ
ncbi:MAG: CRISPR-associated endoribonuclease Cas6, partial [Fulvivirga sp.]